MGAAFSAFFPKEEWYDAVEFIPKPPRYDVLTTIPEELVLKIAKLLAPANIQIELIDLVPSDGNVKDQDSYVPGVSLVSNPACVRDLLAFQRTS